MGVCVLSLAVHSIVNHFLKKYFLTTFRSRERAWPWRTRPASFYFIQPLVLGPIVPLHHVVPIFIFDSVYNGYQHLQCPPFGI